MRSRSLQAEILTRLGEGPDRPCISFYGSDGKFRWQTREEVYTRAAATADVGQFAKLSHDHGPIAAV